MKTVNDFHTAAMDCAELAIIAQRRRDLESAKKYFEQSLALELSAIEVMNVGELIEPTFSILHRSAATLALDCDNIRLAEQLIAKALSRNPPHEIADELRDLLEQVYFRRHLGLRGIALEEDELQMSLAGSSVGFGVIDSNEFLNRVQSASVMLTRIVERKQKKPFREKGPAKKALKESYSLYLSTPRAASFAVTMKLGRPTINSTFPGFSDSMVIVNEFMELLNYIERGDQEAIVHAIPEKAYRTNFVHLARRLAPDGNNIKLVGFTALRDGQESVVQIQRPKKEIDVRTLKGIENEGSQSQDKIIVKGYLRYADATHYDSPTIQIIDVETKKPHRIKVPEGMMNDIVKPLWNSLVIVTGIQVKNSILLEDIEAAEDS